MPNKTAVVNVRVEENVKKNAEEILDSLGMTMSCAINILLKDIVRKKGFPINLSESIIDSMDVSKMTREEFDEKLKNAEESIANGRFFSAEEAFEDIYRNHELSCKKEEINEIV